MVTSSGAEFGCALNHDRFLRPLLLACNTRLPPRLSPGACCRHDWGRLIRANFFAQLKKTRQNILQNATYSIADCLMNTPAKCSF